MKPWDGYVTAGVTQFFDVLPESIPTSTGADISVRLGQNGSISGYILPQQDIMNFGVLAQLNLAGGPNAPTLNFSWNRAEFDFGTDAFGNELNSTEDRFLFFFRVGAPRNLFAPVQAVPQQQGQ